MGRTNRKKNKNFQESQKYTNREVKKKRDDEKIKKERTVEIEKELTKYIGKNDEMKGDGDKVEKETTAEINKDIAMHKVAEGLKRNKKIVELKLRGVDEEVTPENDKVLSYYQMRKYLRAMRRFKSLVYFYHGADEEHPLYEENASKLHHLYYDVEAPGTVAANFSKYMYIHMLQVYKSERDELFKKQEAERLELINKLEKEKENMDMQM